VAAGREAEAATVPNGFSEIDVVSGLNAATSFDFAPDAQLFVAEKAGRRPHVGGRR